MNSAKFIELLGWNDNLKVAHWQADTVTNAHKTLGNLYDAIAEFTDDLAETAMGKTGNRDFAPAMVAITPNVDHASLLSDGLEVLAECRAELTQGVDDDLLNILADMSAAINKAKYLLKL